MPIVSVMLMSENQGGLRDNLGKKESEGGQMHTQPGGEPNTETIREGRGSAASSNHYPGTGRERLR